MENIQKILSIYFSLFFLISPLSKFFFCDSNSFKISDKERDTCYFVFQVKSSQCWNWNLPYHKFWGASRSLKVTLKKIFILHLILFWKSPMGWRWSYKSGRGWKLHPKHWNNFNNIPMICVTMCCKITDWICGMLAIIVCWIFCFTVCFPEK